MLENVWTVCLNDLIIDHNTLGIGILIYMISVGSGMYFEWGVRKPLV